MKQAETLALPRPIWKPEYVKDTSLRRQVLEYYDREHVSIRRYLAFLGVDPETSKELVQESFLKLHEHLLAGGDRSNLRAWLYRVAHNLARNIQSAFHVSRTDPLPSLRESRPFSAKTSSPEEEVLAQERIARLQQAMQSLSTAQRKCLVLRAQGLKYREIAEVLGISVSSAGENIQRGLEKLKELL